MPQKNKAFKSDQFDKQYYQKFYSDPKSRVSDRKAVVKLANFVCHYLKYLDVPIHRVLDLGCGTGLWKKEIEKQFPGVKYIGVEFSDFLVKKYGWKKGSIVDFKSRVKFDLVICQGVLQYLTNVQAEKSLRNLLKLSKSALYLEVLTKKDWKENCDQSQTDGQVHLRSGLWYRSRLKKGFNSVGGGVFLRKNQDIPLFELENGK